MKIYSCGIGVTSFQSVLSLYRTHSFSEVGSSLDDLLSPICNYYTKLLWKIGEFNINKEAGFN